MAELKTAASKLNLSSLLVWLGGVIIIFVALNFFGAMSDMLWASAVLLLIVGAGAFYLGQKNYSKRAEKGSNAALLTVGLVAIPASLAMILHESGVNYQSWWPQIIISAVAFGLSVYVVKRFERGLFRFILAVTSAMLFSAIWYGIFAVIGGNLTEPAMESPVNLEDSWLSGETWSIITSLGSMLIGLLWLGLGYLWSQRGLLKRFAWVYSLIGGIGLLAGLGGLGDSIDHVAWAAVILGLGTIFGYFLAVKLNSKIMLVLTSVYFVISIGQLAAKFFQEYSLFAYLVAGVVLVVVGLYIDYLAQKKTAKP